MATSPLLPVKSCAYCGADYQPTGYRQLRCVPCRPAFAREVKRLEWLRRKDIIKARNAAYRAANREKMALRRQAKRKEWLKLDANALAPRGGMNRAQKLEYHRQYMRAYRAKNALRTRMGYAVRRGLIFRDPKTHWLQVLGYSMEDLKQHLERQFLPGMSWQNMKRWHIDHIVPHSSFSYESVHDPDFRACWALTNLRPIWAVDNRKKWSHRTHLI